MRGKGAGKLKKFWKFIQEAEAVCIQTFKILF